MADIQSGGIRIQNLYKIFGPRAASYVDAVKNGLSKADLLKQSGHVLGLRDINLDIPAGSIQVIMGLSGSGKSTLIRHINRLIDPTAGEVLIGGVDVCRMKFRDLREFRRRQTAMVFQKFALLPHRNVLDNVIYGLEVCGVGRKESVGTAMGWIERVGLKGFEERYPNQLSGGMQQRVGLARALSMDAPVLLMDEAYSALDPLIRMDMQTVLLDLQKEIRKTIVFITHDLDEALRLGDQIAILRDGCMVQQGTKQDIVLRPADEYVTNFVKQVNRGRVVSVDGVMSPLRAGVAAAGRHVAADTTIEDAISVLTRDSGNDHLIVVGEGSRPLGTVSLRQLACALITPDEAADAARVPVDDRAAVYAPAEASRG
ncbi:ABC proline/glycine betaine transporter, ATPase subunit [Caballeronia hypogeia]|uniref:Quaternary amine transport ATP-binding protein n=1 Tax=Caballeronia hypogeia TaxID=1777140 RepID=A0A158CLI1_9BURK|nr:betaine/proline/choline family ABC transporter ATP-binding protein [Caballeronia hypogeia]SAK83205.1 ABC proline/glycine betaine transporter, ATPase subunit [Caballeronia hypogeia]